VGVTVGRGVGVAVREGGIGDRVAVGVGLVPATGGDVGLLMGPWVGVSTTTTVGLGGRSRRVRILAASTVTTTTSTVKIVTRTRRGELVRWA